MIRVSPSATAPSAAIVGGQIGRVTHVDLDARQLGAPDGDDAGLAVPLDVGAHALDDFHDRGVALRARHGALDPNRLSRLGGDRAGGDQVRDRGEVAGDGVAPARGRVRLSTVDDEARRTGRAVERVAAVADRGVASIPKSSSSSSVMSTYGATIWASSSDFDALLGDRAGHQQGGDILRGHVAGDRDFAARERSAHDERRLSVPAGRLRARAEVTERLQKGPLRARAEGGSSPVNTVVPSASARRGGDDEPHRRPGVRAVDHVVGDGGSAIESVDDERVGVVETLSQIPLDRAAEGGHGPAVAFVSAETSGERTVAPSLYPAASSARWV